MVIKMNKLFLILFLGVLLISFASSISIQNLYPVTSPFIVNSFTVNISYGITLNAGESLQNTTFSWNGTNTTLYDSSLVLFMNFDNRSALGENDTFVRDISSYGNNGTVVGGDVRFQIDVTDDISLNDNGQWIFSSDNTGDWKNDSSINFTTTPETISVKKEIIKTSNTDLSYRWYLYDNAGNLNTTETFSFAVAKARRIKIDK